MKCWEWTKINLMERESLIPIMSIGRDNIHMHFSIEYFIDEPVLLGDASAPLPSTVSGERFGLSCARAGMNFQFFNECCRFLKAAGSERCRVSKSSLACGE